jgi:hypothetical protein
MIAARQVKRRFFEKKRAKNFYIRGCGRFGLAGIILLGRGVLADSGDKPGFWRTVGGFSRYRLHPVGNQY